jgi:PAS domain S-box-containing protein
MAPRYNDWSSALLKAVVESADEAIFTTNLAGVIMSWNPAAQRIFGYTATDIVGQPVEKLSPPELTGEKLAIFDRLLSGEKIEHYMTSRLKADGTTCDVLLNASPIRDAAGTVVGASIMARDMTQRNRADDTQRLLSAIVESSEDAIISKDLKSTITSWNAGAERIFGYTAAEAIGRSITLIIPPDRIGDEDLILSQIRKGSRVEHFETIRRRKDGREVPVSLMVSPIRNSYGEVVGASKIARDISERIAAERQILQMNVKLERRVQERTAELTALNEELEAFTYSVAHDLRAPLRGMTAYLQMSREELGATLAGKAAEYIQMCERCAERMDRLVDDILRLSKIGRQKLQRRPIPLNDLVEEARAELRPTTSGRNVDWQVERLPTVDCDPGLTRQVFTNLLSNALKYTRDREKAVIEVRAVEIGGKNAILVRDNGIGFNMQYADKLFAPFERLHAQSEFEGTGVGLAITERIIHKHGGEIWASAKEGTGAEFYFTFGAHN